MHQLLHCRLFIVILIDACLILPVALEFLVLYFQIKDLEPEE